MKLWSGGRMFLKSWILKSAFSLESLTEAYKSRRPAPSYQRNQQR